MEKLIKYAVRPALLVLLAQVAWADAARDARWIQDLDTLSTQLPRLHPNLFFKVSRADFLISIYFPLSPLISSYLP